MTTPDFPQGIDPVEARLTLLTEAWMMTVTIAFKDDTANRAFLLSGLSAMASGLHASGHGYLADILDGWVERLNSGSSAFTKAVADM